MPDQCCGNCKWWGAEDVGGTWGIARVCSVPVQDLPHCIMRLPIYKDEGTTCPTWAAKEESDAVRS